MAEETASLEQASSAPDPSSASLGESTHEAPSAEPNRTPGGGNGEDLGELGRAAPKKKELSRYERTKRERAAFRAEREAFQRERQAFTQERERAQAQAAKPQYSLKS
jgi:hypothetical protein